MESGVSRGSIAIAGWDGAALARPALLQTGASRWCGGVAPGLFVLDADAADGALDMLDGARRQHARQRVLVLRPRKPQVEPAAGHGARGRHERDHDSAECRAEAGVPAGADRVEARAVLVPPSVDGAWVV